MIEQPSPRRGRPPLSERRATRDLILDAALKLFSERGFDGATVRQIAAEVGVSDPALYAHFKGKQDIFDALLREAGPDVLSTVFGGDAPDSRPAHLVIPDAFGRIVEAWATPRARAFTSLILSMGPDGIGSALREVCARLQPIFTRWQERGDLRKNIPVEIAIWQVIGPLSALRLSYLNGHSSPADIAHATKLAKVHLAEITQTLTDVGKPGP